MSLIPEEDRLVVHNRTRRRLTKASEKRQHCDVATALLIDSRLKFKLEQGLEVQLLGSQSGFLQDTLHTDRLRNHKARADEGSYSEFKLSMQNDASNKDTLLVEERRRILEATNQLRKAPPRGYLTRKGSWLRAK
jgi:hypothetical protein